MLTLACGTRHSNDTPDSWFREPQAGLFPNAQDALDRSRFAPVLQREEAQAEHSLESRSFVEIQPGDAASTVGTVDISHPGCRYFLLRGLEYVGGSGGFQLYKVKGSILV